jgi:ATP-binding cassette subfamily B protein
VKVTLRLLSYLQPFRFLVALGVVCMLAEAGLDLVTPYLIKLTIDRYLAPGVPYYPGIERQLFLWSFSIVGVSLFRGLFLFARVFLVELIAQRAVYNLRNQFYDHLQRLPFGFYDEAQTGQLMSRATQDIDTMRRFLGFGMINLIRNMLLFVAVLLLCLDLNWRLALLALWPMPLLLAVVIRFRRRIRPTYDRVQQQVGDMTEVLQESITGVRVVKAFAQEEREIGKFEAETRGVLECSLDSARVLARYEPLMNFIAAIGTAFILWYGGGSVIRGTLTLGGFFAFQAYLLRLIGPVRMLGWIVNQAQAATASAQRIFEVLDYSAEVAEDPRAKTLENVKGHVRFERVGFAYANGEKVLQGIDIDAPPGTMIALLGPTGSGKSTIVHLLPRFYDPTEGRITIDDHDIRRVALTSLRANVGLVLQETFLFSSSIRENIAYGKPGASLEEVQDVARVANIHDFIESLPEGYNTVVGERGVTLSGGQKQRVAIARTLLMNPRILVLDDSTSSVDTETEHMIQRALDALLENRTTFVIAQRLSTVKKADRIIVLDRGRIAEEGDHETLLACGGLYAQIYQMQFKDQEQTLSLLDSLQPEEPPDLTQRHEDTKVARR